MIDTVFKLCEGNSGGPNTDPLNTILAFDWSGAFGLLLISDERLKFNIQQQHTSMIQLTGTCLEQFYISQLLVEACEQRIDWESEDRNALQEVSYPFEEEREWIREETETRKDYNWKEKELCDHQDEITI